MHASSPAEVEKSAEAVGFLALAYQELASRWSSVGPRLDGSELYDDLEAEDDQLSLLTMIGSDALAEPDWRIVRWLGRDRVSVAEGAERGYAAEDFELDGRRFEPWRLEAALHALAAVEQAGRADELGSLPAVFSLRVAERWEEVENAVEGLRCLGVAATREYVDDVHRAALRAAPREAGQGSSG